MILGISGRAGSGKDAAASVLIERYGFVRVGFADEIKRTAQRFFGWDDDRLWGPSERRNEPDPKWGGLTARRALQVLGTEVGRQLHPDVWVRAALATIARGPTHLSYDEDGYIVASVEAKGFVIPDVRFRNEVEAIRAAGGTVLRVVRPGAGLGGDAGAHASENELTDSDPFFDFRIVNDGTLVDFEVAVAQFGALIL